MDYTTRVQYRDFTTGHVLSVYDVCQAETVAEAKQKAIKSLAETTGVTSKQLLNVTALTKDSQ